MIPVGMELLLAEANGSKVKAGSKPVEVDEAALGGANGDCALVPEVLVLGVKEVLKGNALATGCTGEPEN